MLVSWPWTVNRYCAAAAALLTRKSTRPWTRSPGPPGSAAPPCTGTSPGGTRSIRALEELGIAECEAALDAARLDEGTPPTRCAAWSPRAEPVAGSSPSSSPRTSCSRASEINEGWARLDARIAALFRRGQEEGEFRIDLTPAWLTEALYGLIAAGAWAVQKAGSPARTSTT